LLDLTAKRKIDLELIVGPSHSLEFPVSVCFQAHQVAFFFIFQYTVCCRFDKVGIEPLVESEATPSVPFKDSLNLISSVKKLSC
jgi:hypothetical protein